MQLLEACMPLRTNMLVAISEASIPEIARKCYCFIPKLSTNMGFRQWKRCA
jgi:hypothetical protein